MLTICAFKTLSGPDHKYLSLLDTSSDMMAEKCHYYWKQLKILQKMSKALRFSAIESGKESRQNF